MAPVIQGIADCLLQRLRPFLEFFPVGRVSCNIVFLHTIGTHLTPFVMVAAQPYLRDIFKFPVLRNFLRIDMAVIIQYRHFFRDFMKKGTCGIRT